MLCITSTSLFTGTTITRDLLSLEVMVKFSLHWMRDCVDLMHLSVLFETVEVLSGSEWW